MATNFPASLDALTNPTSSDSLSSPSHSAQHANVNDAVEALQAKVGADSSAVTSSHDYKIAQLESDVSGLVTGKILQVVSTTKTDTYANASGGLVTGLTVTITPTSASSDIIVIADVAWSASATANISTVNLYDVTNSTVAFPAASGTTAHRYGRLIQLDTRTLWRDVITGRASPATTSPLEWGVNITTSGATSYVNRNGVNNAFSVSSIYAIEVSA